MRWVGVRYVVEGINVSQTGKPYRSNKGHCLTTVNCSTLGVSEHTERIVLGAATSVSEGYIKSTAMLSIVTVYTQ
jgi:hypothetical protein